MSQFKTLLLFMIVSLSLNSWDHIRIDTGVDFSGISSHAVAIRPDSYFGATIQGVYGGNQLFQKKIGANTATTVDSTLFAGYRVPAMLRYTSYSSPIIIYFSQRNGPSTLTCNSNGTISTIDTNVDTFSFAIDPSNHPYIVYIKSGKLYLASGGNPNWTITELVDSYVYGPVDIAIDSDYNIHIVYGGLSLKYLAKIDGTWQTASDIAGNSAFFSIAVDSSDTPYVAYYDGNANNGDLILAKKSGAGWTKTTLSGDADNAGWNPSMVIVDDVCYVSYGGIRNSDGSAYIKYATYNGTTVTQHNVGNTSHINGSSIAVNTDDNTVHILYYDDPYIRHFSSNNGTIANYAQKSHKGKYTAIATDADGYLHISYTDSISTLLHYATNAPSGTWSTTAITGVLNVRETAIAVDASAHVHICFYDDSAKDLKYATNSSGSWSIQTVDSSGDIGGTDGTCDIALDSNGKAYISYYNNSSHTLSYTTNSSGSWELLDSIAGSNAKYNAITVSSIDEVNVSDPTLAEAYVDIALDGDDNWHKSYFNSGAIHYRTSLGSIYSYDMTVTGNHSRIAADRVKNAYIAFYKSDSRDVKLFSNMTGVWQTETVASYGSVGEYASVALANDDNLTVCYYNDDYKALQCSNKKLDRADNAFRSLYHALDGDNWNDNSGWLSSSDKCTWYGVTCDTDGNISLELDNNNLSGTLPPELLDIPKLKSIKFGENTISGEIPGWIGNLTNLQELNISNNQLSGPIPAELGNLTNLQSLALAHNQLTDFIPIELGNLTNLQDLDLSNNQLSGSTPNEIGSLTNLQRLNLSHNHLSGSIPIEFGNLENLQDLNLRNNRLTGFIPKELGRLTNLQQLNFYYNQLSGTIPAEIGNLGNLLILDLGSNQLSDTIPDEIGNLDNLLILDLGGNQLSGHIPVALGNLRNLQELRLDQNQLNGSIPSELESLTNLQILDLGQNQLNGPIPAALGNLTNLQDLSITQNQLSGPIPAALGNLTNLTYLWLYGNQLTGPIPREIGNLSNLEWLYLDHNRLSGAIPEEIKKLTKLVGLFLSHNCNLYSNDSTVQDFINNIKVYPNSYPFILDTNTHDCANLAPIITYLLN